jgi:ABC-type Zn2+ transport system substrate-binding protein/surface adhesin
MQKRDYDQVAVRIYFSFYQLLAESNISLLLEYLIITALRESAGLPLKEAAEILLKALDKIMDGDIEPDDDDDDDEDEDDEDDEDDYDDEDDDDEDDDDDDEDDEEDLSEAHANIMAAHQKLAEAMSGEEIVAIQRQMDEALKAGNMTEYMRLATELQMRMLSSLGS